MKKEMQTGQPGFMLYWTDLSEYLECLSDRELEHVLRMLYMNFMSSETPEPKRTELLAYIQLRNSIAAQAEKYRETVETNTKNSRKRFERKTAAAAVQEAADFETDGYWATSADIDRCPIQIQSQILNNTSSSSGSSLVGAAGTETEEAETDGVRACAAEKTPSESGAGTATVPGNAGTALSDTEQAEAFKKFRSAYPKKAGIAQAQPLFRTALESVSAEELFAALERQKRMPDWQKEEGRYVPSAERWLRERCWEDVPVYCFEDRYVCLNRSADAE